MTQETILNRGYAKEIYEFALKNSYADKKLLTQKLINSRLLPDKYSLTTSDLNEDDDIICKDKRADVQYIGDDDYEYECVVAYNCPKGLYAVDEVECDKLPKNAIRLPKEGFTCKKGFELYENPDTTYCYKPYQCPKGSYAVSKNECGLLPKNARRSVEDGYECFKGYVTN